MAVHKYQFSSVEILFFLALGTFREITLLQFIPFKGAKKQSLSAHLKSHKQGDQILSP
jgi:hypothetical protein